MLQKVDLKYASRIINHGPVVLVSAYSKENVLDVTPVAWCMPLSKNPPRVVLEIGAKHYIRECIAHSGNFAVNIVSQQYVKDMVYCGSVSGRDENKLENSSFTSKKCSEISAGSLGEAIAVLECRAVEPELADRYNLVAGEVVAAEADGDLFDEYWRFSEGLPKTLHHLGGRNFCVPESSIIN